MKTKFRKILSLVLSLVLVLTCISSSFSLSASATLTESEKIANLKAAWAGIQISPDILFESWFDKSSGIWQKYTNVASTDVNGEFWPVVDTTQAVGGLINKPNGPNGISTTEKPVDIDDYTDIFFYYQSNSEIKPVQINSTNTDGTQAFSEIYNQSLPSTSNTWQKFELMELLETRKSSFDGSAGKYLMRIFFESDTLATNFKCTNVLAVKNFINEFGFDIDADTADWTLVDWLRKALTFDFSKYSNGSTVIDLIDEYFNNSETNFTIGAYVNAYRTNSAGSSTLIPESELSLETSQLLHNGLIDDKVEIATNNSTIDFVYVLPNIKEATKLGIFTATKNIKGLKIYASNISDAIWQEKNLVYSYSQDDEAKLLTELSYTFSPASSVRYVRFSITDTVNTTLDVTELYIRGVIAEETYRENIVGNSENRTNITTALQNIATGEKTDVDFDTNRFGANSHKLQFYYINDLDENTVYDFMIGTKGKESFNLIINLQSAYEVNNITLTSGSEEEYHPTNMKYYLGNTVDALFAEDATPVVTYTSAVADGVYSGDFQSMTTQYVRIEILNNACTYYDIFENGQDTGEDYLLTVIGDISVYGSKTNFLVLGDDYVPHVSEIRSAWYSLGYKPEVVLDTFWTKNSSDWSDCSISYGEPTEILRNGTTETVNTHTIAGDSTFLIHIAQQSDNAGAVFASGFQNKDTGVVITDYEDFYFYAKFNYLSKIHFNPVGINSDSTYQDAYFDKSWKKYYVSKASLAKISENSGKLGRIQFPDDGSAKGMTVSTVMGVKKLNHTNEFGAEVAENLLTNNWTLAQWIVAAAKVDFSKYVGGEYVIDALNDAMNSLPEYKALYDLVKVWKNTNKITKTVSLDTVSSNVQKTAITSGTPFTDYSLTENATINKYTFKGTGANNTYLAKGNRKATATLSSDLASTSVVYLSYYIPEAITRDVFINTTFNNSKMILPERNKWELLSFNKSGYVSTVTCNMDADYNVDATLYLGPVIVAEPSTLDNVTGNTIEDYFNAAVALNLDNGVYTNEAAFKAARESLNTALIYRDCKINGDGSYVWDDNGVKKSYYTENNVNYTAFRVFAQYICPNDSEGNPLLSQIILNGKTYQLESRGIIIDRNTTNELSIDTLAQTGAKYSSVSGSALTEKYWAVFDNGETSTVIYSIILVKVNKANAESATHTTRAVLQYDDNGETKTVYSKQVQHGTIHDIWKQVGTGEWFPGVDFENKDNWDYRPLN